MAQQLASVYWYPKPSKSNTNVHI